MCKLRFTEYRNCTVELNHNRSVIPVTGLYNTLTVETLDIPSSQEGICGLKLSQAYQVSSKFILLFFQALYFVLG